MNSRRLIQSTRRRGAGAPPGSSTRAPWWKVPTRWAMLQPHLSLPRCCASKASTFRTSDCEIPNSRAIRGGAIPALKAARTAFTWPRVSERTACAGRPLEGSFLFRDLGLWSSDAARLDGSLPRRFASSSAAARSDATGARKRPCRPPPAARTPGLPALGEALEPMPLRTDLVSGAECDRVTWSHHAATEAMGQGEERGPRRPRTHRKAAWTTPLRGRLGSSQRGLAARANRVSGRGLHRAPGNGFRTPERAPIRFRTVFVSRRDRERAITPAPNRGKSRVFRGNGELGVSTGLRGGAGRWGIGAGRCVSG